MPKRLLATRAGGPSQTLAVAQSVELSVAETLNDGVVVAPLGCPFTTSSMPGEDASFSNNLENNRPVKVELPHRYPQYTT